MLEIYLEHQNDPAKKIKTLAFLDMGFHGTFVAEDILDNLGVRCANIYLEVQTLNGKSLQPCRSITGLKISPNDKNRTSISLPKTYSRSIIPVDKEDIPTPSKLKKWSYLKSILKHLPSDNCTLKVGILIGLNCPRALEPHQVIQGRNGGPFAMKTKLGWCVGGPMVSSTNKLGCHRVGVQPANHYFAFKENIRNMSIKEGLITMYNLDFYETSGSQPGLSIEDERFLKIMKEGEQVEGQLSLPLPLRTPEKDVPNNRNHVVQRASWLKKKLTANQKMFEDYKTFMDTIISKGYAKVSTKAPVPSKTWYIPHHGVYHPHKPDKIRVVFDCSLEYKSYCLNKELLQGPDLTNQLIGVLLRFRHHEIAVIADIEAMFYQVKVPEKFQDYLRFLWWPDGDLSLEPVDQQMCVHLFGATSSPSCSNYALRQTAEKFISVHGKEAADILVRNVYVDDMLKSFRSSSKAIKIIPEVVAMAKSGHFKLTKFHCNDRDLLKTIPEEDKSKYLKDLDMSKNPIPEERTLGMVWCPETDKFRFIIDLKEKPLTRRGILSMISSIYDPLGIAGPYLLEGKKILQQICIEKGWDDPLSVVQIKMWKKWKEDVKLLKSVRVDRCVHPNNLNQIVEASIHHFADASCDSYGQVSYLRLVNEVNQISCKIIMAKSRVAPAKRPTVPRLELTASVLSVKESKFLKEEFDFPIDEEFFWTDSQVV